MTKQEKIRKRVEKFVSKAYWYEGKKNVVVSITNALLSYLHSQGVVIKVEREWPTRCSECNQVGTWVEEDYTLVDPLIEDK